MVIRARSQLSTKASSAHRARMGRIGLAPQRKEAPGRSSEPFQFCSSITCHLLADKSVGEPLAQVPALALETPADGSDEGVYEPSADWRPQGL
jgi:hypothetical protein